MRPFAEFIQKHPVSFLLLFALLVLAAIYPALNIRTDFNLENFFPKEDPTIEDYQSLEREFGRDDNIIMVGFRSDSLLTPPVLADLKRLVDSAKTIPNVNEVRSLWSADDINSDGVRLEFTPYLEENRLSALNADTLRRRLADDPFASGFLINERGDATAFYLEMDEENNFTVREQVITNLREILSPYRSEYDFKISGIPYYRNQYIHYLNDEIAFYITLSSLLVALLLWFLYRSMLGLLFPMLIVWFTILLTLAIMQLTGGYFEVMSSTIAPILLCVGIADSVHMLSKYDDARQEGLGKRASITEMILTLGSATFLTSITTAIGFGTLLTSDIVPMNRFGIYTAVGVMVAFAITITFLPSVLTLTRSKTIFKEKSARFFELFSNLLSRISSLNSRHYKKIVWGFAAITLAAGSGMALLKVNGKVFGELGPETEPIRHAEFFSRNLAPPFPMEFIIDTGRDNGVMDPGFIEKVEAFTGELQSYEEVDRIVSFNTILKEVHKAMAPGQYLDNPLPGSEQLIAQYVLLLEFNESDALQRVSDFSYRSVRVSANVYDVGSYRINQMQDSLSNYLAASFPDSEVTITGSTILSANLNGKMVSSLMKSILLAFVLISIIMAVLFRNVRMVLISLVPNILPLLMVAGFMGFSGIDIRASTAVIFTIAFGIAVDDSIHYLARVRVEMKRGRSLEEALRFTTLKTGK
ncbi:MAG: MMPL family transporter, partial [Balneolaceae bacterium]|nr:MMPL family transporter [Balneolaceae bacterium]